MGSCNESKDVASGGPQPAESDDDAQYKSVDRDSECDAHNSAYTVDEWHVVN